jgi:hypothetical protein
MSYRCEACGGQCTIIIRDDGHIPTSCAFGMEGCDWFMILKEEADVNG